MEKMGGAPLELLQRGWGWASSCTHLDPAVLAVLRQRADGERALGFLGQGAHGRHEILVIVHAGEKNGMWGLIQHWAGCGHPPRTHLQTKTSSGAAVLGVMIHGATRKTTVSVKIGVSSKP